MDPGGYTVQVTGLSPRATEKDVSDFFAFSGGIQHVEIVRFGEDACTAYVTFKDHYFLETACLLSGATIVDQRVCITRWGNHEDESDFWNRPWNRHEDKTASTPSQTSQFVPSAGEAVSKAQEMMKTMLTHGYTLGKDALTRAKAFDESHQVSTTAASKVADLNQRIGLSNMFYAGVGAVKSMDEKYHVSQITKTALSETGKTAASAADTVVKSSYFSTGALWVSGALNRAAKAASDMGSQGLKQ